MATEKEAQIASAVLMVRPVGFHSNPLTAPSNRFQGKTEQSDAEQQASAAREFEGLVAALRDAGVTVIDIDDTPDPPTPDSVFPNNWVTTHADGTVVLYPMEAANRRTERRLDIVDSLAAEHGFKVTRLVDISAHELEGRYLEGTGSLVLDRVSRVAYACLSSRTHLDALGDFAQQLDYDVVAFDAVDRDGVPIYHTNVMMSVGEGLAIVCAEAIPREEQRRAVIESLERSGHDIILLTFDQMDAFAGNMLELKSASGQRLLAMSAQAEASLTEEQRATIDAYAKIVSAPINDIESSAGGSVRCMLAEIHLPLQDAR
ncbi:MAG: arginine deiminase-related protein [Pseudomonadota bacterium]